MKKFLALAVVFSLLGAFACQKAGAAKDLKKEDLDSQQKKVSYAIGLDIGKNFKARRMDIDADVLLQGLKHGQSAAAPLLSDEEIRTVMTEYQ